MCLEAESAHASLDRFNGTDLKFIGDFMVVETIPFKFSYDLFMLLLKSGA